MYVLAVRLEQQFGFAAGADYEPAVSMIFSIRRGGARPSWLAREADHFVRLLVREEVEGQSANEVGPFERERV